MAQMQGLSKVIPMDLEQMTRAVFFVSDKVKKGTPIDNVFRDAKRSPDLFHKMISPTVKKPGKF